MSISLQHLEQKKLVFGMNKLREAGIDVEQWLAMLNADPRAMQRLVAAWPGSPTVMPQLPLRPGIVYDATAVSRILGLPVVCKDSVPKVADGEIVIYYGGWSFKELRLCSAGKKRMNQEHPSCTSWYEHCSEMFETKIGYYKLLLPVPGSSGKTWKRQLQHLTIIDPIARPAPAIVAATTLLVHLVETYEDLLDEGRCRCKESCEMFRRTIITARGGKVRIQELFIGATTPRGVVIDPDSDNAHDCDLWLSAILKI